MIDAGRGLENLVLLLYDLEGPITAARTTVLQQISVHLTAFQSFICGETNKIPEPDIEDLSITGDQQTESLCQCLSYIRSHLLQMSLPEKRSSYQKTLLSLSVRLKAALNVSPVRVTYALRVSCLLALSTLLVQTLHLPHGRWLLFTLASVSLPYADDVGSKAQKRILATLIGGAVSIAAYSLFSSSALRTVVMMLSGYLSFYFVDYAATFACSTVGALGGAVLNAFGWQAVSSVVLIRFGYIVAGVLIALLANRVLFPFYRKKATKQLFQKYISTTGLLSKICQSDQWDPQLYYSLIIQSHLLEEKLAENAAFLNWTGAAEILEACRQKVREAHRSSSSGVLRQKPLTAKQD